MTLVVLALVTGWLLGYLTAALAASAKIADLEAELEHLRRGGRT